MSDILTFIKVKGSQEQTFIKYLKQIPRIADHVVIDRGENVKIGRVKQISWQFGNNDRDQQTVLVFLDELKEL